MTSLQKYKYATIILSAAVFILIVVLLDVQGRIDVWQTGPEARLRSDVGECNGKVAEWRRENPAPYDWAKMPEAAKRELAAIIAECSEDVKENTAQ